MLIRFTDKLEAGIDEAGRGALAGPVVAAAIILPPDYQNPQIKDSKQLSITERESLRNELLSVALVWNIGIQSVEEIDRQNILQATFSAMHEAISGLGLVPDMLLVDGNRFRPYPSIPHQCLIKGDATYLSIAAASILAKTFRDDIMKNLHADFPEYQWDTNKGYPTKSHRDKIKLHGLSPWHRRSFTCLPQTTLFG
ncbi:MAG: ribonuclease HII [Bacteroidia bacterium]|nr:ribonuclease HII [Bacteroidia bacterium]